MTIDCLKLVWNSLGFLAHYSLFLIVIEKQIQGIVKRIQFGSTQWLIRSIERTSNVLDLDVTLYCQISTV